MISALYPLASERLIYCLTNSPNVVQWLPRFGHGSVYSPAPLSPMRPRHAALLTPPSPTPAFLQNVANSNHCHTSEKSPVTPIIATDPKMRSCKSCVCHTCDPLPPLPFHLLLLFSRHESLAPSKFPRSWLQICPFVFKQLQDAPPATLFLSCFCIVAGGW